ncbi:MAG: DUF1648 domain-containing protein [Ferruginibacter sp.]|nr:DUF1648 domain-containing protein [Ferruginibacter sp.]
METKPRIKINKSKTDRRLELFGGILLLLLWLITVYVYLHSPDTIPIHFDDSGKPNNYGSRNTLFFLTIPATIIYAGITQLNKYPHILNYPVKITAENAAQQYSDATRLLRFLKAGVLLIFILLIVLEYLTALGITKDIGTWFLPLILCTTMLPTIFLLIQGLKRKV